MGSYRGQSFFGRGSPSPSSFYQTPFFQDDEDEEEERQSSSTAEPPGLKDKITKLVFYLFDELIRKTYDSIELRNEVLRVLILQLFSEKIFTTTSMVDELTKYRSEAAASFKEMIDKCLQSFPFKHSKNLSHEHLRSLCNRQYQVDEVAMRPTVATSGSHRSGASRISSVDLHREGPPSPSGCSSSAPSGGLLSDNYQSASIYQDSRYEKDFVEEHKLGQGGFGAVYQARNRLDQKGYAIKKIRFKKVKTPLTLPRSVIREVIFLSSLNHENVVRYFGNWMEINQLPSGSPSDHLSSFLSQQQQQQQQQQQLKLDDELSNSESSSEDIISPFKTNFDCKMEYHTTLFIQMELCSFSLKKWMNHRKEADKEILPRENLSIIMQIIRGLEYIHKKGLIHRDLKPSNIFITEMNDIDADITKACLKIGDFGVATFIEDEAAKHCSPELPKSLETSRPIHISSQKSKSIEIVPPSPSPSPLLSFDEGFRHFTNALRLSDSVGSLSRTTGIGTAAYASPEQLRKDVYDEKTDIYSLGIILLELYFKFTTKMERAHVLRNVRESRKLPEDFVRRFSREASLILWLTHPNPHERPQPKQILAHELFGGSPALSPFYVPVDLNKELEERDRKILELEKRLAIANTLISPA